MDRGMICVPVCSAKLEGMLRQIAAAAVWADIIEVRLDCLENFAGESKEIQQFLQAAAQFGKPSLVTLRSPDQGGGSDLTADDRIGFWNSQPQCDLVDLEEDILDRVGTPGCIVIGSHHDFRSVPADLEDIFRRLADSRADIVKLAVMAEDAVDAIPIWKLLKKAAAAGKPLIPIAMGEAGKWTRILGPPHGAYLTYAALSDSEGTADGQITARDMRDVYRVQDLTSDTEVYGVIGDPVSSSLSPLFQNAAFRTSGVDAVFIPFLVKDLRSFIDRMVGPKTREIDINFRGFSVTMPHKLKVMEMLDEMDASASAVGAVNTVKINEGRLIGYNTDAGGFISPLRQRYGTLSGKRIALFGSGGAAMACISALVGEGAQVDVFVRNLETARSKPALRDLNVVTADSFDDHSSAAGYKIVVNATPLGMKGVLADSTILTADQLDGVELVYDLVTTPAETVLIRNARSRQIPVIGGMEMLIAQGVLQFEIWTGRKAPADVMRAALVGALEAQNLDQKYGRAV